MLGLITFALFALVIMNGFAAGIVAALHFWNGIAAVARRAMLASLSSGIVSVLLFSGILLEEGFVDSEGMDVLALVCVIFLAVGTVVSLPGAFIMSRKIGDTAVIDPDIFN